MRSYHDTDSEEELMDESNFGQITNVNITEFDGKIETKGATLSWTFTSHSQCCEDFGAYVSNRSISKDVLLNETLIDFTIKDVKEDKCALIISTSCGNYIHKFYNYHNGYYSHVLRVYRNDSLEKQCIL